MKSAAQAPIRIAPRRISPEQTARRHVSDRPKPASVRVVWPVYWNIMVKKMLIDATHAEETRVVVVEVIVEVAKVVVDEVWNLSQNLQLPHLTLTTPIAIIPIAPKLMTT